MKTIDYSDLEYYSNQLARLEKLEGYNFVVKLVDAKGNETKWMDLTPEFLLAFTAFALKNKTT